MVWRRIPRRRITRAMRSTEGFPGRSLPSQAGLAFPRRLGRDLDVTHNSYGCHSLIPTVEWKETHCWFTNYDFVQFAHLRSGVCIQEDGLVRAALP
jgi:hypothetical protein